MVFLSLTGVSKIFDSSPLFEDVTIGIEDGEKVGFVGANGVGKSTLLRIVSGEIEPDGGTIARNSEVRIARLEQRPSVSPGTTLDAYFRASFDPEEIAHDARFAGPDAFRSYCRELALPGPESVMDTFSGGMVRKASLAACLAGGANFLLLDEPTNHLDIDTIEWLERMLSTRSIGFILVTHDRYFLDAVCTSIMEVDEGRIYKYAGGYRDFTERKAERIAAEQRAEERRVNILRTELEWLKRGPKARTGKDKKRKSRIQDLKDGAIQREHALVEFSSSHRRLGKKILELDAAAKSYDGRRVVSPFSYSFRKGERIGLIGPNGSGKSTFLKMLCGEVDADEGAVVPGENTAFGYLEQTGDTVDARLSVLEYIRQVADRIRMPDGSWLTAEQFLERFQFPRSMLSMPLELLSGGELRRLHLSRLLSTSPNFLLLDEPTNDLDIDTIRTLEEYLTDFGGCMVVVSHDRALLNRLTDYLFIFDGNGSIRGFVGNYEDYREAAEEERTTREREKRTERQTGKSRPVLREERTALSFRERQEYDRLFSEIAELEAEQSRLESFFQSPDPSADAMAENSRRYDEILVLIREKTDRWEELALRDEA